MEHRNREDVSLAPKEVVWTSEGSLAPKEVVGTSEGSLASKEVVGTSEGSLAPKEVAGTRDGMDELAWEEVSRETIVKDEWMDFRRSTYRLPDGKVAGPFYSYTRRDYVVVLAIDKDGRYICVRQYRQGIQEVTTEFPAGGIEWEGKDGNGMDRRVRGGCGGDELALAAARRELREETGYESDDWEHLLTIPSNATLADNYAYIYLARGCRRTVGQELDDTEFLNVRLYSSSEIEEMIRSGRFQQAVHVMAWYFISYMNS